MPLPLRTRIRLAVVSAAALAVMPMAAQAHDHHGGADWQDEPRPDREGAPAGPDEAQREAWLADCRARMPREDREPHPPAADRCEMILHDYYAQFYAPAYPHGQPAPPPESPGPGYYAPPYAYAGYPAPYGYAMPVPGNCCAQMQAPVMMVPVPQPKKDCVETIEYVYEDVPVRPRPHRVRPLPDKRVKIVPDKRVKMK